MGYDQMNINMAAFRTIKSFVLRKGRMTKAQTLALKTLWPNYGIDYSTGEVFESKKFFPKQAPTVLEIGFGNGQTLLQMAKQYPEVNFLGIEVYQAGIARLLMDLHSANISNVRVISGDAINILQDYIPDKSINIVQLFFPDPWPKTRHHKRRLIQSGFVSLISKKLLVGGIFHFATDWEDYAKHALIVMKDDSNFVRLDNKVEDILLTPQNANAHLLTRSTTKFELRGQKLGYDIYEFMYLLQNLFSNDF
jgi:tRNA (guanine-N7-)-methyltransferase